MPRSLDELLAHAGELADKFERYEPREADRGEPAMMALHRAAHRSLLVERELADAVRNAPAAGASWSRIGAALDTFGEAARQRYRSKVEA